MPSLTLLLVLSCVECLVAIAASTTCDTALHDDHGHWMDAQEMNAGCSGEAENATCTLTCDSTYIATGTPNPVTCQSDGNWDSTTAECDPTIQATYVLAGGDFNLYAAKTEGQQAALRTGIMEDVLRHINRTSDPVTVMVTITKGSMLANIVLVLDKNDADLVAESNAILDILMSSATMSMPSASAAYTEHISDTFPVTLSGNLQASSIAASVDFPEAPLLRNGDLTWWVKRNGTMSPFPTIAISSLELYDPDDNYDGANDLYTMRVWVDHGTLNVVSTDLPNEKLPDLNAILSSLLYTPDHCPPEGCQLFRIDQRIEQVDHLHIYIEDEAQMKSTTHNVTINIVAPFYETCGAALLDYEHSCGCYYIPSGVTDLQLANAITSYLPLQWGMKSYLKTDGDPTRTFVQGCCAEETPNPQNNDQFTKRGEVGLCYNTP